jgi:hypothetical protein
LVTFVCGIITADPPDQRGANIEFGQRADRKLEVGVVQFGLPFRVQQIEASIQVDTDCDHGRIGAEPLPRPFPGSPRRVLPQVEPGAATLDDPVQDGAMGDSELRPMKRTPLDECQRREMLAAIRFPGPPLTVQSPNVIETATQP